MNENIEKVLAVLDGFRMSDEMTYSAYSILHDEISMLDDLLKAQGPRAMTLEEVAKWIDIPDESKDPIFVEYGRKMKFGHSGWRTQFFGFSPKFHAKIYGVELRCWTSRPTEHQREAVKWE